MLEIGSPKQRALLAMLVLHLNRVVPLDVLVEELWGERPLASASAQTLVSRLFPALEWSFTDGDAPQIGAGPIQKGEELLRDVVRLGLEAGVDGEVARARYFPGELVPSP